jgi:four helix bundle protein
MKTIIMTLKLEELEVYQVAMEIGELVWKIVMKWDSFSTFPLGTQIVKAADSIANNIAEGYGRYFYKENKQFCYYSRGSAKETGTEALKAFNRGLITPEEYKMLNDKLTSYFKLSFRYINSIGKKGFSDDLDESFPF